MIRQVHITPTKFVNESRLLKQANSVLKYGLVDQVYVIAMYGEGLKRREVLENGIVVIRPSFPIARFFMLLSLMPSHRFEKIMLLVYSLRIILLRPKFLNLHYVRLLKLCSLKKVFKRLRIIYEAHELETESNGLSDQEKVELKRIELKYLPLVDYTFVVSPSIEKWYKNEYGISNITTVMNVPLKTNGILKQDLFREKFGLAKDDILFIYNGALFEGRGIQLLLQVFETIQDKSKHIIFMGSGVLAELIQSYEKKNNNIHFLKAVPPSKVIEYTACADIGISLIENVCLSYYYSLPNKIFEYLISEIPMIVANMEDMKNFVQENQVGVVANDFTEASVVEAIDSIVNDHKNFKNHLLAAKEKFNWEVEEKKMIPVYQGLI